MLWIIDIDGTLINVHKNQIPAWNKALKECFGFVPKNKELVSHFGKPFKSVLRNIAKDYNVEDKDIERKYEKALSVYTTEVNTNLKQAGGEILPGAVEFLEFLGRVGQKRAIATGNPKIEGEFKLKYFKLQKYFDIVAYCGEKTERVEIVKQAIKEAEQKFHLNLKQKPERVYIIGDSIHDVESAKLVGATSIAVTTGETSRKKLASACPDRIISSVKNFRELSFNL